jgi:hypothetical protein
MINIQSLQFPPFAIIAIWHTSSISLKRFCVLNKLERLSLVKQNYHSFIVMVSDITCYLRFQRFIYFLSLLSWIVHSKANLQTGLLGNQFGCYIRS